MSEITELNREDLNRIAEVLVFLTKLSMILTQIENIDNVIIEVQEHPFTKAVTAKKVANVYSLYLSFLEEKQLQSVDAKQVIDNITQEWRTKISNTKDALNYWYMLNPLLAIADLPEPHLDMSDWTADQLVMQMSYDIRSPVAGLEGCVELLNFPTIKSHSPMLDLAKKWQANGEQIIDFFAISYMKYRTSKESET